MSRIGPFAGVTKRAGKGRRFSRSWTLGSLAFAVTLILLVGAQAAFGATRYVDGAGPDNATCAVATPCATISHAVSIASAGDVIEVAAGTYNESVTVGKQLILRGAQAGIDASGRSGEESIVKSVAVTASNVIVNGFSFNGTGSQVDVSSPTTLSGVVVKNDIFEGYGTVALPTYDAGNILILQNLFANPAGAGEAMQIKASSVEGGCDGSEVLDNGFVVATTNGAADVNFSCTDSNSSNVTVSGNTTTGNTAGSSFTAFSGVIDGISVTENSGSTSGSSIFFFGSVSGSALIERNSLTGGEGSAVSIHGADITSDTANTGTFTIASNTLTSNVRGIYVAASALGSGASVTAHFNDLFGNIAAGVENASSVAAVDATDNWWGCNAGPAHAGCAEAVGDVTYDPWLVLGISASPTFVSTEASSTLTADLTHNSAGEDTSGSGAIPDGTNIEFGTNLGSVSPSPAPTVGGTASATLESSVAGTANASATLDNETVFTPVTFTALSVYAVEVLSDSPLAYWRLGDALDTSGMSDLTGNHPGAYVNGAGGSPQLGISGDTSTAAYFVGNGQYGYVNGIEAPKHAYTMEAWVRPNDSGAQMIMQQGGSGALYVNGEGHLAFVPDSNEVGLQVTDPKPLAKRVEEAEEHAGEGKAAFVHVVGTWEIWNGSVARLYVGGLEREHATSTHQPSGAATLYIGYGTLAPWFRGYIDEAAYYPTALSAGRVEAHYLADPPPPLWMPHAVLSDPSPGPSPTASPSPSSTGSPASSASQASNPQSQPRSSHRRGKAGVRHRRHKHRSHNRKTRHSRR